MELYDKSTSTVKIPVHKYTKAGKYTVSLKVKNTADSSTITNPGSINSEVSESLKTKNQ